MSGFIHHVDDVVQIVEGLGIGVLVIGTLVVLGQSAVLYVRPDRRQRAYYYFRRHLGRVILLGLELLIIADAVRTVIVDQSAESIAVLSVIVVIRIVLSWSLTVEVEGVWPWSQRALDARRTETP